MNGRKGLVLDANILIRDFPIWTEDQDFFGNGVATWTTDRGEIAAAPMEA